MERDLFGEKNPNYGKPLSEETKEKLRQSHLGKKVSEETRLKLSEHNKGEKNYFYGKKLTHWKGRPIQKKLKKKLNKLTWVESLQKKEYEK